MVEEKEQHEEIELSPEDEAALDAAWAERRAKKRAAKQPLLPGPEGGELLATSIADWWNTHGEPTQEDMDAAAAELDGTGWGVWFNGEWMPVNMEEDGDGLPEDALVVYAAARAPAGGVDIAGKHYIGGQFIPSSVVAEADPATKARITKNANAHKERVRSRFATREQVKQKTARHADKPLSSRELTQARQMLAGLVNHHGEHVVSRIDELAEQTQTMLDKIDEAHPNDVMQEQLEKRMAMLHVAQQWLHERGHGQEYEEAARKHQEGKKREPGTKPEETTSESGAAQAKPTEK